MLPIFVAAEIILNKWKLLLLLISICHDKILMTPARSFWSVLVNPISVLWCQLVISDFQPTQSFRLSQQNRRDLMSYLSLKEKKLRKDGETDSHYHLFCFLFCLLVTFFPNIYFPGYARLDQNICDSSENPCSRECIKEEENCDRQCHKGNYSCSLDCNRKNCKQGCDAKRCNLKCNSKECVQSCNKDVKECITHSNSSKCKQTCDAKVCLMTVSASIEDTVEQKCNGVEARCDTHCYGGRGNCKQHCDAERCNLECNGKECEQKCNGKVQKCHMHCNASNCIQVCDAGECHITGGAIHDIPEQKYNGGVDICDAQCYVSSG